MNAARYYGKEDVRVESVEPRSVGSTDLRVEVSACGICGSDLHEYRHGPGVAPTEPHPLSGESVPIRLGHEFAGRVVETGEDVDDLSEGDSVAVNPICGCSDCRYCRKGRYRQCPQVMTIGLQGGAGGFAESAVVPAENAVPVPDGVPRDVAAITEPLSVALHAVHQSSLEPGDSVAVFGAGPIGLGIVQTALTVGARTVHISEPEPSRRSLASKLGAATAVDPTEVDPVRRFSAATDGGVDVSFEVAGVRETFRQAVRSTGRGGNTTIVSVFDDQTEFHPNLLVMAERTVTGAFGYQSGSLSRTGEFATVLEYLRDGRLRAEPLATDRIPLREIVSEGFERLAVGGDQVKILVEP